MLSKIKYYILIFIIRYSVGKSCILIRYVKDDFIYEYQNTIAANFLAKQIQKDKNTISLQIWDTNGTERYKSMTKSFFRNSEACLIVFDLTSADSFDDIEKWRELFLEEIDSNERKGIPFVLLGNKNDLIDKKEKQCVKDEVIQNYCKEHDKYAVFFSFCTK